MCADSIYDRGHYLFLPRIRSVFFLYVGGIRTGEGVVDVRCFDFYAFHVCEFVKCFFLVIDDSFQVCYLCLEFCFGWHKGLLFPLDEDPGEGKVVGLLEPVGHVVPVFESVFAGEVVAECQACECSCLSAVSFWKDDNG